MRIATVKGSRTKDRAFKKLIGFTARRSVPLFSVLIGAGLLTAAVGAYNHGRLNDTSPIKESAASGLLQPAGAKQLKNLFSRLSLQPEADRLRRRLGQRFLAGGKERAVSTGTLTVGTQQYQVAIVRSQNDDGEQVEIALNGGPASLTWSAKLGALSGNASPSSAERSLIERLALDSPDQFILAQLRGAAYYTVAHAARPAGVGASDTYTGSVWDVIQVSEPVQSPTVAPLGVWRLYQINTATGLIDKVVSQEQQGQNLTAETTSWITQGGEAVPAHITWKQGTQTLMEFTLNGVAFGPMQ